MDEPMQVMPKRPRRNQKFWALVHRQIERFPSAYPVVVTVCPKEKEWGWCHRTSLRFRGGKFYIRVREVVTNNPDVNYAMMADCWMHEYSHTLNWSHLHDRLEHAAWHDETWGAWYSRLYRSYSGDK